MARQILPIAGAIVGAAFGAPQLGFAIGSIIGNAVDPMQIKGPSIGDIAVQTSRDGVPRPIVFGVAAVFGNIIDRSEPKIVKKKERQGKGGPETVTEHVYMSFCIRVCEGPITSISRIWENEKLVYDVRPGSTIVADSAEFATKLTIYLGGESQLPDPTFEAIHGVGNTPAYRGTAYVVFSNKDLTEFGGAIPQYRFEVNCQSEFATNYTLISLMHMNGANTGTTFTDETGKVWTTFGNAQTSTTESKFNGSSGYFDGSNSYISTPIAADWQIHKDGVLFTLEAWVWIDSTSSGVSIFDMGNYVGGAGCFWTVSSAGYMRFVIGGSAPAGMGAVPEDQWVHVAIVCDRKDIDASDYRYMGFVNGVKTATVLSGLGANNTDETADVLIGTAQNGTSDMKGYIAEFRASIGAIYTADFIPPAASFPNP